MTQEEKPAQGPSNGIISQFMQLTGYSDREMAQLMKQPRTQKILERIEAIGQTAVIFEVKQSKGCVAGHKEGDYYLFPNGIVLDLKNSTQRLCPFLMPPMARMMWVLQERVWEGLDPLPLYATGQCDDVGLDCDGWGRVIIAARILTPEETRLLIK